MAVDSNESRALKYIFPTRINLKDFRFPWGNFIKHKVLNGYTPK